MTLAFFFSFADESVHHEIVHRSPLSEARHSHPNCPHQNEVSVFSPSALPSAVASAV